MSERGTSEALRKELSAALDELGRLAARGRKPTRFHARALLIPLGRLLLEGEAEAQAGAIQRARQLTEPLREAWEKSVQEELALACAEHVLGVDPRHLDHPRFDFGYALAARERLEARLAAASALDLQPPEELLDGVARADELLQPYLERDRGERS